MSKRLIFAGSITYAMKVRDILNRNKIAVTFRKNQSPSLNGGGCNYEIYVENNEKRATDILENSGINLALINEMEEQNDLS